MKGTEMIEQFKKWAKENIGADDHDLREVADTHGVKQGRFKLPKVQKEYEKWIKNSAESANNRSH